MTLPSGRAQLAVATVATAALTGCGSAHKPTTLGSDSARAVSMDGSAVVARGAVQAPALARDAKSGRIFVAFGRDAGTGPFGTSTQVFLARSDDGGRTFSPPVAVAPASDANAYARPSVDVTPTGTVLVEWEHAPPAKPHRYATETLRLARSTDGGKTFTRRTIFPDHVTTETTLSDMAVAPDGHVIVGWLDYRTRRDDTKDRMPAQVRSVISEDDGQTFSPASILNTKVSCSCCRPSFAFRDADHAVMAWRGLASHGSYDIRDIQVADSGDGGRRFGSGHTLHADNWHINGCPVVGPGAAFDSRGRLDVGYYTGARGRTGVWLARATGTVVQLDRGAVPSGNDVTLAEAPGGTWATWSTADASPTGGKVHVGFVDNANKASTVLATDGHNPQIVAGDDGHPVMAYSTTGTITKTVDGKTTTETRPGQLVVARLK